jgi:hypothetical protein
MKAVVDVVTISPKKAQEYLDNMVGEQRKLRPSQVDSLAEDMKAGNFRLSCDAIVLIKGKLGNGQHRMAAVVKHGSPQPFILMRTDDEELYKVIDSGIKRTVGDACGLMNGGAITAVANLVCAYEKGQLTTLSFTKKPNRVELIEYVESHANEVTMAVQMASRLTTKMNLVSKSVPGAFLVLARREHGEKADAFLMHVYTGNLPDSACALLRDRFLKSRVSSASSLPSQYALALMIKAFNAHIKNSKVGTLKMVDGESFPKIIPHD